MGVTLPIAFTVARRATSMAAPRAVASSVTGVSLVDTSSRPGKTIYKWLTTGVNAGSITFPVDGYIEAMILAGGGSYGYNTATDLPGEQIGAGGAGGLLYRARLFIPAGTYQIGVGLGGAKGQPGGPSFIGDLYAAPGGGTGGHTRNLSGGNGGSGGGGGDGTGPGGKGVPGLGYDGGNGGGVPDGGGGGGAGGPGVGPVGGPGRTLSITGTPTTFAAGGSIVTSGLSNSPVANSGNGASYSQGNGSVIDAASGQVVIVTG